MLDVQAKKARGSRLGARSGIRQLVAKLTDEELGEPNRRCAKSIWQFGVGHDASIAGRLSLDGSNGLH